jgi:hypothetical protein
MAALLKRMAPPDSLCFASFAKLGCRRVCWQVSSTGHRGLQRLRNRIMQRMKAGSLADLIKTPVDWGSRKRQGVIIPPPIDPSPEEYRRCVAIA